jgi:hypothetical protein
MSRLPPDWLAKRLAAIEQAETIKYVPKEKRTLASEADKSV